MTVASGCPSWSPSTTSRWQRATTLLSNPQYHPIVWVLTDEMNRLGSASMPKPLHLT